jgi:hypothetical protein
LDYIQANFAVFGNNDWPRDAGLFTDPVTAVGALHEDESVALENASQPPPRNWCDPRHPAQPCQQATLLIVRSTIALDSLWFKQKRSHVHKRALFFMNRENEID